MDDLVSRGVLVEGIDLLLTEARKELDSSTTESEFLIWRSYCDCIGIIRRAIASIPAVDAVPVVRCKDCLWSMEYNVVGDSWCMNPSMDCNSLLPPDAFCSYGERNDNATD